MLSSVASEQLHNEEINLKEAAFFFRAINNKFRQQIIKLIHQHERLIVRDIYVKLRSDQSKTSVHLAILRKAKLVHAERKGKNIFYSVNYQQLTFLHMMADKLLKAENEIR
jgi:ArsR family transcriptional regulator, virulence genes transcriptional regulator